MEINLIKPKQAAELLMCSERTLEAWRREEKGPCYYKIEGKNTNVTKTLSFAVDERVPNYSQIVLVDSEFNKEFTVFFAEI